MFKKQDIAAQSADSCLDLEAAGRFLHGAKEKHWNPLIAYMSPS